MHRQNIFEILKNSYNVSKEMNKIRELFYNKMIFSRYENDKYSIEEIFESKFLKTWKQRGSFLCCAEIRGELNLPDYYQYEDDIIKALEYAENIIYLITKNSYYLEQNGFNISKNFSLLTENIDILLEYLNYEKYIIKEQEMVLLVPKNPAATAVAEISSKETALAILKYNHSALKGDLDGKRNLLYQISLEYEPLLKNPINGFNDFFEKTNNLLNNLHIRHNNQNKEDNKNLIINIDEKELEKWYDELYQLLLFCTLIKDNLTRKGEVEKFLKSIKGTKA